MNAIEVSLNQRVSLIQGPPGTGKTQTAAALIATLCKNNNYNSNYKILVCCPSNVATDNLANRIKSLDSNIDIVRIVSRWRQDDYLDKGNLYLHNRVPQNSQRWQKKAKSEIKNVQVVCTTCMNSFINLVRHFSFSTLLIDEANQAIEPECLLPITTGAERFILVGDHKQLQPVTMSVSSAKMGLEKSMFMRLIELGHLPSLLDTQYRMHPQISRISSTIFYDGLLRDGVTEKDRIPVKNQLMINPNIPIMLFDVEGEEDQRQGGTSYRNVMEAYTVCEIVKILIQKSHLKESDIGIITPYTAQVELIREQLPHYEDLLINTANSFQGEEREYIIFSTVRTNEIGELGITKDPHLVNVSITRAKRGLFIVGDITQLKKDQGCWGKVIPFFEDNKLVHKVIKRLSTPQKFDPRSDWPIIQQRSGLVFNQIPQKKQLTEIKLY